VIALISAGPALYLLGQVLFRFRVTGSVSWVRLAAAVACVAVGLAASVLPVLALSALLVGVLVLVIAVETVGGMGARPAGPA